MKKGIKLINLGILALSLLLMVNCDSSDENETIKTKVDIEEAKLSGFQLSGIKPVGVEITQPVIVDNKEETPGRIVVTAPYTINSLEDLSVSITSEELNLSKFSVTPGSDVKLSFEEGKEHRFTVIKAIGDKEPLLNYVVTVVKEAAPLTEVLEITDIKFEQSKNKNLPNDITITKRVKTGVGRDESVYLLFPDNTDFSNLVPTITYEGAKLYYTQDSSVAPVNMDVEYPTVDTSFDFKYPKRFFLAIKNTDGDEITTVELILDVENPVKIETESISTPDTVEGGTGYYVGLTQWINQGNHEITYRKGNTYEDMSPVITPPTNVITVQRDLLGPRGLLKPGESANVNVIVSQYFPEGTYKTTAVFYNRIYQDRESGDLFEPARLSVTSKIVKE